MQILPAEEKLRHLEFIGLRELFLQIVLSVVCFKEEDSNGLSQERLD